MARVYGATVSLLLFLVLLLTGTGCQTARGVGEFGQNVVDYFSGNTPIKSVALMEDKYFPDERRIGINKLSSRDFGRRAPYTERYRQIAQYDSDWLVRAAAIRALNRARDKEATPVFIKSLEDSAPLVRQEAAKALANIPDENAAAPLLRVVDNAQEQRDVRIAAADALKHYRRIEVGRGLAGTLTGREFAVAWQARKSLIAMTGQDLAYDEAAWLEFFTGPDRPLG